MGVSQVLFAVASGDCLAYTQSQDGLHKSIEIWQKRAALGFQLVPREQRLWVWQGLITD